MALPAVDCKFEDWVAHIKLFARSVSSRAVTTYQALKKSYDWTNGCRKLSIVINPFMMLNKEYCPAALREADGKGALMCFGLLVWALLLIGRVRSLCALYTASLLGVVGQYGLLHCGAWVAAWLAAAPAAPAAPAGRAGPAGRAASAATASRMAVPAGGGDRDGARMLETRAEVAAEAAPAGPLSLASVASALAFCSVPVAACALVAQLVSQCPVAVVAPLPAAWCTLLATCALLPPGARNCQRAFVLLPCGVLYTFLALLFIV